jgi:hypothetical protein
MKKILIFGAGSIGNHMTYACTKLGYKVFITDISSKALIRMQNFLYPIRYKKWNNKINIVPYSDIKKLDFFFDLVVIGTPPNTHYKLFKFVSKYLKFKKILIEKPIANYLEDKIYNLSNYLNNYQIYCGYNHSVNPSLNYFLKQIEKNKKNINYISVNWKEGWNGILNAHPWLKNEFSSYLGNLKIGGGATQEHSHGIHALICILNRLKIKNFKIKDKNIYFKSKKNIKYDYYSSFLSYIKGVFIKYETDLITSPAEKKIIIKSDKITFFWTCNYQKNTDAVEIFNEKLKKKKLFKKTRSSEFENEIKHIMKIKNKTSYNKSDLNLANSLKVFNLIQSLLKKNEK